MGIHIRNDKDWSSFAELGQEELIVSLALNLCVHGAFISQLANQPPRWWAILPFKQRCFSWTASIDSSVSHCS